MGKHERKRPLARPGRRRGILIIWIFRKLKEVGARTEFIWLKTGIVGGLL